MASAAARYKLLKEAAGDIELQAQLRQLCKSDILFWFDYFCYTFNPRVKPSDLPFNLMPFQRKVVKIIEECIKVEFHDNEGNLLQTGEPCIIEKSRDLGLTWIISLVFQYFWIFEDGNDFLIGSKREDLVDEKGNRSTIFQKLRYNANMQPTWILPKLKRHHDGHMKLINPVNGNAIMGEAATPEFGVSGRARAALLDEFAFHPYGKAAYETVSQTTNSIFLLSTPNGKANEFYKMRSSDQVEWIPIERD